MADSPTPGPSAPKRLRIKNPKRLTEDEMRAIAYLSSSSDEEPFPDSGSNWSDSSRISDERQDALSTASQSDMELLDDVGNVENEQLVWTENPPNLRQIVFTGKQELKVPIPNEGKPIDFFYSWPTTSSLKY